MFLLETLRDVMVVFASNPVIADDSKPSPVGHTMFRNGYAYVYEGMSASDYTIYIGPGQGLRGCDSRMALHILKDDGRVVHLTFRLVAYSSAKTYEFRFNLGTDRQLLQMWQAEGRVVGGGAGFERVQCVPMLVVDLVEAILPPVMTTNPPMPECWLQGDKLCIACGAHRIHWAEVVCGDCRQSNGGPVMMHPNRLAVPDYYK